MGKALVFDGIVSGGSATVGMLNTNNSTALTPLARESFGGIINLNRVAKTGDYNDLNNKPTIPAAQVQADWEQTNPEEKSYIRNKPTIPDVPSWAMQPTKPNYTAEDVGALPANTTIPAKASSMSNADNDNFITPAQALGAFDRKMTIRNAATLVINSELAVADILNSYCLLTVAQDDTVTLVLPDITNSQQLVMNSVGCVINATIGTGGDIALASAAQSYTVYENGFSDMEAGKMYEINILCIGINTWAVTAIELKTYNSPSSNATNNSLLTGNVTPLDNNSGNAETHDVEPENTESV